MSTAALSTWPNPNTRVTSRTRIRHALSVNRARVLLCSQRAGDGTPPDLESLHHLPHGAAPVLPELGTGRRGCRRPLGTAGIAALPLGPGQPGRVPCLAILVRNRRAATEDAGHETPPRATTGVRGPRKRPCGRRSQAGRGSVVPLSTSAHQGTAVGGTAWPVSQRWMSAFGLSALCRRVEPRPEHALMLLSPLPRVREALAFLTRCGGYFV